MMIERKSYSRAPWRLITGDGREVYAQQAMDHASLGKTMINAPICGDTKTECTDKALALLERLLLESGNQEKRNNVLEEAAQRCDPANQPDDWTEYAKNRAECADNIRAMKA